MSDDGSDRQSGDDTEHDTEHEMQTCDSHSEREDAPPKGGQCSDDECICRFMDVAEGVCGEYKELCNSRFATKGAHNVPGSNRFMWRAVNVLRRHRLKNYYKRQNDQIDLYIEAYIANQAFLTGTDLETLPMFEGPPSTFLGNMAVFLSFVSNIFLVVIKIVAAYLSGSMSVYASMLDSILDVVSGCILWMTGIFAKRGNRRKYPMGRGRWVGIGIIMFACVMASFGLTLIRDNIQILFISADEFKDSFSFDVIPLAIMTVTIVLKFLLFIICRFVGRTDASRAYAQDHINDVFTNIFGTVLGLLGYYLFWAIDPIGSIIIAVFIIIVWLVNAHDQIRNLVGKSGSRALNNKLTYLAIQHDARIIRIDFVETFHFGENFIAEVHIVLDPDTLLADSHEVEEALKNTLEKLPEIDRAYVHVDYEGGHQPIEEHKVLGRH